MRSPRQTQVCCDSSLCQHPDCWRLNLQQVREAVWRRNGIEPEHSPSRRSVKMDQVYLTKEQRLESADGGLPTLNVVDLFSDLDARIKSAPDKKLRQPSLHRRSTSLPSLSPDQSQPTTSPQQIKMPYPSPAISPFVRTEYQRKMLWKKKFTNPSRADTSVSRESGSNTVKLATIGVHEVYEPEELYQDWEEVYVTSAYLVWCPSKKKRKKRKDSSMSSKSSTKRSTSTNNKVIPKDVTEDFVPAAMETIKTIRPKSTKTPTGGHPYSPRKSPANQTSLRHYGMEDLSDLPKPILSGMLKRITQSNEVSPEQYHTKDLEMISSPTKDPTTTKTSTKAGKLLDSMDLSAEFESLLAKEETASKVRLAVDINSRFTTPEEDEEIAKQKEREESEKEKQEAEVNLTNQLDLIKKNDDKLAPSKGTSRELLRMNSIGVPIEDLPSPKSHHCMSSIPRRLSLGAALEPVNIVPIDGSPANTPPNEPEVIPAIQSYKRITKRPKKANELFVNIPHGRAGSALEQSPYREEERQIIYTAFRNSPSPVRAPAPTPISPDKYSDFFRHQSRVSQGNRNASLQDDDILISMRKWNTLSNVYDTEESSIQQGLSEEPISILRGSPVGTELVETHNDQEASEERIFLTEEVETSERNVQHRPITPETDVWADDKMVVSLKEPPTETRGRSPSPGSKTWIPKDIIEEFHGNLYGKQLSKAEANARQKAINSKSKEIVLGPKITTSGWRPPRSRTPIQFAETPARFAPRPLKQPPQESVPKSLQIVPIPTQNLQRPKSTPPRITAPNLDFIAQVLSDSSLHDTGSVKTSLEAQGPSTGASRTGSIPPPPSPEALILTTEHSMAVSTLEPLHEEDERSSRNTSVVDLADKEVVNARLSPLGGRSEISEESIDLPKELCGDAEGIDEEQKEAQEDLADPQGSFKQNDATSQINELESKRVDQVSSTNEKEFGKSKEQVKEQSLDTVNAEDGINKEEKEASSSPLPENLEPNELKNTESLPQDIGPSDLAQLSESKAPRLSESPEVNSPLRGSPEPVVQPPGSPDMTTEPDFTEGVDMGLDLTAELQAAMEGLDDFVLDDENDGVDNQDDDNVDENIESKDENEDINTTRNEFENRNENSKESEDGKDENSGLIGEENEENSNHTDEKSTSDENKNKNDLDDLNQENIDRSNDKINVNSEDKIITHIKDDKNDNDSDITKDKTNKIDPEINYIDRTSPLLDA